MKIVDISYYFPKNKITYDYLDKKFPNWKIEKTKKLTGVNNLYYSDKNETSLNMAISAIKKLSNYKSIIKKIDGLIFCTQTPNRFIPSNSSILHGYFDLKEECFTLDISHGCSGYIYSLELAKKLLSQKTCSNILILNADTYSKIINPRDRMTKVLFSDAASATYVKSSKRKILFSTLFGSSGKNYEKLSIMKNGFEFNEKNKKLFLEMDGMGIMSFVNSKIPNQIELLLKKNKINKKEIKFFVFHQASKLAIDSLVKLLNLDKKKVLYDLNDGNTVSASIPICLKKAINKKKIKSGDKIILCGFGVGLSWGSLLMTI